MRYNFAKKCVPQSDFKWNAPIKVQLEEVEYLISSIVSSEVDIAEELSRHLIKAGGKRIRPSLVILSSLAAGVVSNKGILIKLASSAELLHLASLVHDDVIDNAQVRRGVNTANYIWGNKISVLGGDFLLSKAWSLIAGELESKIVKTLSHTAVLMTEAEILQAKCLGTISLWEQHYWKIIKGKTAGFFSACSKSGAMLSAENDEIIDLFADYGEYFGIAFQITDDLLDFTGNPEKTGKSVGADVADGKYTLPVLIAWRSLSDNNKDEFVGLLHKCKDNPEIAKKVASIIIESNSIESSRKIADDYIEKAINSITTICDSEYKQSLIELANSIIQREK